MEKDLSNNDSSFVYRFLCLCVSVALHFHLKDIRKSCNDPILDFAQREFSSQQLFHRGYRFTFTADDQIEVTQVRIYVEGEAVRGHPTRNMHANSRDFAARSMHASQTGNAKRIDSKIGHRANQDLFQIAHETMHVLAVRTQVYDWVADNLAETVVRYFAAAIRFENTYAARR